MVFSLLVRVQKPRVWQSDEIPVAFWAWQNESPNPGDVRAALDSLNARVLFIRAGQIDFEKGKLQRIRALRGTLPRGIDLHLVYNATRVTLAQFESVNIKELAAVIASAFQSDCQGALSESAVVIGLQLDFDVPTRLLSRYTKLIRELRKHLKSNAQVSITGLPTWMGSTDLSATLAEISFWIPQCYGAMIPERLDIIAPIASPSSVADWVGRARKIKRPFYAGLAAYGYAAHYSRDGQLIAVRGDLDPALIAGAAHLELVERRPFDGKAQAGEWRYVYRARSDVVIDGLAVRSGEYVMLDVPSVESLRESARMAREEGGEFLLGLCLFRLPGEQDKTNLSLREIACALRDENPTPQIEIQIAGQQSPEQTSLLTLTITNSGTASALLGEEAIRLDVGLPEKSLRSVKTDEPLSAQTFFDLQPCAERRANRLRLQTQCLAVGARVQATLEIEGELPESMKTLVSMQTPDNREWRDQRIIAVKK